MHTGFGKSLTRAKAKNKANAKVAHLQLLAQLEHERHRAEEGLQKKKLTSIWETSNMQDFLAVADERETGYMAERDVKVITNGVSHVITGSNKIVPQSDDSRDWFKLSEKLPIPHRPKWDKTTTSAELEQKEKEEFLEWRRLLAKAEEDNNVQMTPYEKNLEVWRQLWRVVERSDFVLEIVDARNPMAFRCADFESYVKSHKSRNGKAKKWCLLINKADLLVEQQREAWAKYFVENGIPFLFFAAKPLEDEDAEATEEQEEEEGAKEDEEEVPTVSQQTKASVRERRQRSLRGGTNKLNPYAYVQERAKQKEAKQAYKDPTPQPIELTDEMKLRDERSKELNDLPRHHIYSPNELLDYLAAMRSSVGIGSAEKLVCGMVGYPNVGKSSTINAILGCKKVVVSATPGKTKHFQTLPIPEERRVMLCDCPGLVFPSFGTTRETMICDGVLPIDCVRDYVSPIAYVCRRIPRVVFERRYVVSLDPKLDVDESVSLADRLLNTYSRRRGYMSDHNKPSRSVAAKEVLKDYVDGRLVFVHPPPGLQIELPSLLPIDEADAPVPAAAPKPAQEAAPEAEVDDGEEWEDISSADELRNLSDDEYEPSVKAAPKENPAVAACFFDRPRSTTQTVREAFNSCNVATELALRLVNEEKKPRKKRHTNHQLEPESWNTTVMINEDGQKELIIDTDDEIEVAEFAGVATHREKRMSKRQERRVTKRMGQALPTKKVGGIVGIEGL